MKERMLQGYLVGMPPIGYSTTKTRGLSEPNEKAPFIRLAFELKDQGYSHDVISSKLKQQGLYISIKKLTEIFKNAYYCGYIKNKILGGEVVKGHHKPIIEEDVFIRINKEKVSYILNSGNADYDDPYPLKDIIICSKCKKKWTGYPAKKKTLFYYKCNTIGCQCNKSVKMMHNQFSDILKTYKIPDHLLAPLKYQLKLGFDERNKSKEKEKGILMGRLRELEAQIQTVKIKFATDKIPADVYKVANDELTNQYHEVKTAIGEADVQLSNYKPFIDFSINLVCNLDQAWISSDSRIKRMLQKVIFPVGIEYDKANNSYRTIKVNGLFTLFASISHTYKAKGEEQQCHPSPNSALVVPTGIEPQSCQISELDDNLQGNHNSMNKSM